MTKPSQAVEADARPSRAPRVPGRRVAAFQLLALAVVVAVAVLISLNLIPVHALKHAANWKLPILGILTGLAVLSELTSTQLPSGLNISGSFLAITVAAVLLGGPPAAIVAVFTIAIGWFRSRESGHGLRQNLVTFSAFALLSGVWVHWIALSLHVVHRDATLNRSATYFLLVFATFMIALAINFALTTGYGCWIMRVPIVDK